MKEKHYKIVGVSIIAIAIATAGLNAYLNWGGLAAQQHLPRSKSATSIAIPGEGTLREMDRLNGRLAMLATPPPTDVSDVNLRMFGYAGNEWRAPQGSDGEHILPPGMDFSISFAFSSEEQAYCVINGKFVGEGAGIGGGARVVKIESSRVLVEKGDYEAWIPVLKGILSREQQEERVSE